MSDRPLTPPGYMLLTNAEYRRLLAAAECDDMLIWCEVCGAWLDRNDPAAASTEDFTGCWKAATVDNPRYANECRSWRAPDRKPTVDDLAPGADLK